MHDTVWFETNGVPSVALVSSEFEGAAITQASALGLEDARCVYVAHPIQDASDAEMAQKLDAVWDQVTAALSD